MEYGKQQFNSRLHSIMLTFSRTDLDKGAILGQQITTDTRTGSLIVALLAVLSTIGKICDATGSSELIVCRHCPSLAPCYVHDSPDARQWKPSRCIV